MCGRYALAMVLHLPSQILVCYKNNIISQRPPALRRRLREYRLPVAEPSDTIPTSSGAKYAHDTSGGGSKDKEHTPDRTVNEKEDSEGIRQSYNIAPGYIEPVYRAIIPHDGENPGFEDQGNEKAPQGNQVTYILQGMKWGKYFPTCPRGCHFDHCFLEAKRRVYRPGAILDET